MDNKNFLEKILPHNKPMILIDDVIDYSIEERWLKSIVTISEKSFFYDKKIKGISSVIGLEYMAQTVGCYIFYKRNEPDPKIGFLLGTRCYNNTLEKFELNKSYTIEIKEIFLDEKVNLASFDCSIYNDEHKIVATATVNAYQSDNAKEEFKNE